MSVRSAQSAIIREPRYLSRWWWPVAFFSTLCWLWIAWQALFPGVADPVAPVAPHAVAPPGPAVIEAAPQPLAPAAPPVDALALLIAARRVEAPSANGQSKTMAEAAEKASAYVNFASLAARTDPEGLYQAAVWAWACANASAADASLRCVDERLREPGFDDSLLLAAAAAGHVAALGEWTRRHPGEWMSQAAPDGRLALRDAVFALASRGSLSALQAMKTWCSGESACVGGARTGDALAVVQIQISQQRADWSDAYATYLTGTEAEKAQAVVQGTQIREALLLEPHA